MNDMFDERGVEAAGGDRVSMLSLLEPRGEKQSSGAVRIMLPGGIPLDAFYLEDTGDVYVECRLAKVAPEAPESLFRDLLEMNFFWDGTQGFTVALRKDAVMLEGRENEACLADESALDAWLGRVVDAVSTLLPVLTMPRGGEDTADGLPPEAPVIMEV